METLPLAVDAVVVDGVVVVVEVVELPETLPVPVVVELVVVEGEVVVELVVVDGEVVVELVVVLEPDTLPVPVVVELVVVLLLTTAGQVWVRLNSVPPGLTVELASSRIEPAGADAKKNFELAAIVPVVAPVSKTTAGVPVKWVIFPGITNTK